jgi:Phage ABA sandwich domain
MNAHRKTQDQLTASLAAHVLQWRVTPDRFLTGRRGWLPRWKFQPTQKISDAIRLLEAAEAQTYSVAAKPNGDFCVTVTVTGVTAKANARTKALAICLAIAAALGIEV